MLQSGPHMAAKEDGLAGAGEAAHATCIAALASLVSLPPESPPGGTWITPRSMPGAGAPRAAWRSACTSRKAAT